MKSIKDVVAHASAVKGYMHPRELLWLCATAQTLTAPAHWCEIGCWQGRSSTAVVGGLPPGSQLLLVDNFSGPTTREMPDAAACQAQIEAEIGRMREWVPDVTVRLAIGESDVLAQHEADGSFDVVFIDGDHKYRKVVADILAWRPKMKPGGLMSGHDFTNKCGVEPAVRELFQNFGQVPDSSIWFARV